MLRAESTYVKKSNEVVRPAHWQSVAGITLLGALRRIEVSSLAGGFCSPRRGLIVHYQIERLQCRNEVQPAEPDDVFHPGLVPGDDDCGPGRGMVRGAAIGC